MERQRRRGLDKLFLTFRIYKNSFCDSFTSGQAVTGVAPFL